MTQDEWSASAGMPPDSAVPITDALLDRYLAGEASASERTLVEHALAKAPDDAALARLVMTWKERHSVSTVDDARARIGYRLGGYPGVVAGVPRVSQDSPRAAIERAPRKFLWGRSTVGMRTLRHVLWSAGGVVIAALALVLLSYRTETTETYATRFGQQATFTLNDGTRVTLAPRTTLRLIRFGGASRTVELDGQAYFQVTRSAGAPFLVRTGSIATRVLGTSFLIRHYSNDARVHVAVAEGKVDVASVVPGRRPLSSPVTLTSGYAGDITDSTVIVNALNDLTPETDWLRGQLVFRNATVSDVLQTLNRWYGFQFRCGDSTIAHKSVTIALDAQSPAIALSTLEQFLSVHLTVTGDTVTLTPYPSKSTPGMARKQAYDVWIPTREIGR